MEYCLICSQGELVPEEIPKKIRILPLGHIHSQKGDFIVDQESFAAMDKKFKERGLDIVIDYEHQTLANVQAPAGGWIKALSLGEDAILAEVEWTKKAEEYIRNREYRYLSPVVLTRKKDKKAIGLHSVALTNTPAIDGFPAIAYKDTMGGNEEMELKKLAALLGLPEDATESAVEAAVRKLAERPVPVANSTVLGLLGLKDDARTEDVTSAIMSLRNDGGVKEELEELKKQLAKRDAGEAVALALKEGKISAAMKEWAEGYAASDLEGFKAFVAKAPVVVPMGRTQLGDAPHKEGTEEVDPEVLKNMGLTEEEVNKYLGKEAEA